MSKIVKLLALATIAGLALVGCKKQDINEPIVKSTIQASFTAGMPQTRTYADYDNKSFEWSADDVNAGNVKIFEFIDGDYSEEYDNNGGSLSEGIATFTAELTDWSEYETTSCKYSAFYPATGNNVVVDKGILTFDFPEVQTYTEGSFDKSADFLISKLVDNGSSQPIEESVAFSFARINAVAKMNIKNFTLSESETVQSVSFTATGKVLADEVLLDVSTDIEDITAAETKVSSTITVNFDTPAATLSDVWFTCLPATLEAGDAYEVVITTNLGTYTKAGTISSKPLAFTAGNTIEFTVNFSGVSVVGDDIFAEGDYIILASSADKSKYYALSSEATGSRLSSKDFAYNGEESLSTDDASLIWHIAASGANYTVVSNEGKYLSWTSDNYANTSSSVYLLSLASIGEGLYNIYHNNDIDDNGITYTRYIAKNSKNQYFAFYKDGQRQDLLLIPATYEAQPTLSVDVESLTWAADETDTKEISATATNADGTPGSCLVTVSPENLFAFDVVGNTIRVTPLAENTSDVACTAELTITFGELSKTVSLTQAAAGAGGSETLYVKVTSEPADWSGTYLIVEKTTGGIWNGLDAGMNASEIASISEDQISSEVYSSYEVEIETMEGGYSIKVLNGKNVNKYIGGTSGDNKLNFNSTKTLNTLSLNADSTVKIVSNTSTFLFNSTNSDTALRFRYYKSSTTIGTTYRYPYLFKKQ